MFEFHKDKQRYFEMQAENAEQYVIPFIEEAFPVKPGMRILEIGCGEGGVLKAFVEKGLTGVGVELVEERLVNAREFMKNELAAGKVTFISKDIYDVNAAQEFGGEFEIIVLKDVIEHIFEQKKLISRLKNFLKPGGVIYFGFPPWQMPFGGHQQICRNKLLANMPYYHLLPKSIYKGILNLAKQPSKELLEIKETGISIERFERIVKECDYKILHYTHYLVNPIYRYKFGWKARKQAGIIKAIPWVRNFFTTCVYYLIAVK
ncbi:MAG: class I SAM-dependent methyltransferase [Chitinophagaceae bacterium]|nr:MAG: class I SAM-dependent methyltransferase [Chitinophagaceae bacterium]